MIRCLTFCLLLQVALAAQTTTTIPFVGCRSEGMADPIEAPSGIPIRLSISIRAARQLAYFKSGVSMGVLGPRDWNCLGTYGSSGAGITVGPGPLGSRSDLPAVWSDGSGPLVEIQFVRGDGSGGGLVAPVLARLFPAYRALARAVLQDYGQPVPTGPYPGDQIVRKSATLIEFHTPAHTDGMGTYLFLKKDANPVDGAVILLNEKPDVLFIFVRLSPELNGLTAAIVRQAESEALRPAGN